jgi:Holliday junction DNA helicase RuvA
MIGRLRGRVVRREPGTLLLDVGGVGYELHIPLSTFYRIPDRREAEVELQVHTYVREGVLQLYGFHSHDEREAFERLIGVSGVGPKVALAVLSGIEVGDLEGAVRSGDRARLESIPGIGRKTAERILLDLRDRLESAARRKGAGPPPGPPGASEGEHRPRGDAVSALTNLGYSPDRAIAAVDAALAEDEGASRLEDILRDALGRLIR